MIKIRIALGNPYNFYSKIINITKIFSNFMMRFSPQSTSVYFGAGDIGDIQEGLEMA